MRKTMLLSLAAVLVMAGCGDEAGPNGQPAGQDAKAAKAGRKKAMLTLTSPAFEDGKPIPKKYTGEGDDSLPPLAWSGAPEDTKEFALLCDDPDAPTPQPWVHLMLVKIPGNRAKLAEDEIAVGVFGQNGWGKSEYGGPMPPRGHGEHRYIFKLYALDAALDLKEGASKADVLKAMEGHIIGEGQLVGTYERK